MKKYHLFCLAPIFLVCITAFSWISCSVCTISIENSTSKTIDSIRFKIRSDNSFTFLIKEIQAKKKVSRLINENELKLGHYFFLSSIIYSKDSVYNGPEVATDIVVGEEQYRFIITEGGVILKMD